MTGSARYCHDSCRSEQKRRTPAKIPRGSPLSCYRRRSAANLVDLYVTGDARSYDVRPDVTQVFDLDGPRLAALAASVGNSIRPRYAAFPDDQPAHLPGPHPAPLRLRSRRKHPRPFGRKITFIRTDAGITSQATPSSSPPERAEQCRDPERAAGSVGDAP